MGKTVESYRMTLEGKLAVGTASIELFVKMTLKLLRR